jgi:DNA primase
MDAVSEVKSRLSIEDVISEYVQLKRAGKNYKGLSPFTSEKTPSFVVSPDKQIWHDFSSGKGGDVFSFVQEAEGLDFKGALELLSRKAGVDLEQYQGKGQQKGPNKERLYQTLEAAAKFYQVQLSANKDAFDYVVKKRRFDRETILSFQIGYSPDTGNALIDYLLKKKFTESEIKAAGLTAQRRGGLGDMFRGRIMIPLHDPFGRVVGFTARLLREAPGAPKYINTPATPLYDKSRHIYGLHLAKKAIQKEKFSVLVEGNLDVISSHQAGILNVVATAGTAMTEQQLKTLGRLTPDVRLAFDEDRAGIAATERAIPIASKVNVELSIITIPSGKDPDELIQQDPKLWLAAISEHTYALDWLIDTYTQKLDLVSAAGKRQFSDVVLAIVRGLNDEVERDHYIQKVAKILDVSADSIRAKLSTSAGQANRNVRKVKEPNRELSAEVDSEIIKVGDRMLSLALMLPGTRGYLDYLTAPMLASEQQRALFTYLKEHPEFDGQINKAPDLLEISDYVKIVALQFEELYGDVDTLELQYEAARLRARLIDTFVKTQKKKLAHMFGAATDAESTKLLEKVRELDQLLNRIKE